VTAIRTVPASPTRFDAIVRLRVHHLGRARSAFRVCGAAGLLSAVAVATVLVLARGLPVAVVAAIAVVGCATFLALAMAMKIVTGEETLVYYHHEIAILLATGMLVWLLGQPVLPFLDATMLGVGAFLACGRVGCLMVGCCHGRPHPRGVRYRREHADAGFAPHLVGVALYPVQLVEALWVAATVAVGVAMVLAGRPAGAAFAWYVVVYDVGRFFLEFARGDAGRPYYRGFSQAQWLSLLLTCGVAAAELSGVLPLTPWHVAAAPALALAMLAVAVRRRGDPTRSHALLHPGHLDELARALAAAPGQRLARTSLGILFSGGWTGGIRHHTLSREGGALSSAEAEVLARALARLFAEEGSVRVVAGAEGVHHVLPRTG
jgi:hypothetical protein